MTLAVIVGVVHAPPPHFFQLCVGTTPSVTLSLLSARTTVPCSHHREQHAVKEVEVEVVEERLPKKIQIDTMVMCSRAIRTRVAVRQTTHSQ